MYVILKSGWTHIYIYTYKTYTFCFYIHFSLFSTFRYIFHKAELKLNIKHFTETLPFVLLQGSETLELNTSQHNYCDDVRIQEALILFFLLWFLKLLLFILASFSYSKLPVNKWKFEKYQKETKKFRVTNTGTKINGMILHVSVLDLYLPSKYVCTYVYLNHWVNNLYLLTLSYFNAFSFSVRCFYSFYWGIISWIIE